MLQIWFFFKLTKLLRAYKYEKWKELSNLCKWTRKWLVFASWVRREKDVISSVLYSSVLGDVSLAKRLEVASFTLSKQVNKQTNKTINTFKAQAVASYSLF